MKASGIVLCLLGVTLLSQVLAGGALQRLGVLS